MFDRVLNTCPEKNCPEKYDESQNDFSDEILFLYTEQALRKFFKISGSVIV